MNVNERYLIDLLRSLLKGEKAPQPTEGCTPAGVLSCAETHSVAGMAYYGIETLGIGGQGEVFAKWSQLRDKAIVKDLTQQSELDRIGKSLEQAGIRYLPLKGSVIKHLYPQSDMRTMSDIDMLIDESNAQQAREIMQGLGYTCEHFGYDVHDIYYMPPVMNVEIHRSLFGEEGKEFRQLFADPWSFCEQDGMLCNLRPNVFFAYVIAHALKHLEEGGTGIRTVMDLWVCVHSDMGIEPERSLEFLEPSGKGGSARQLLELSEVWFGERPHTEQTLKLEEYILGSGTYGTIQNQAQSRIEKQGRAGYLFRLIFPTFQHMRQHYPVLKKAPVLLPACWFVRLVTKPFINRRQNAGKLKTLMKK